MLDMIDVVTKKDLQDSELRLNKLMEARIETAKSDMKGVYGDIYNKILKLSDELQPVIAVYKNTSTFGKWIKATLTFFVLLGAFIYTFKALLVSIMTRIN